jgi:hypothetical protein
MQSQCSTAGSKHGDGTGRKAYSIDEFCKAHGLSRSTYYNLKKLGLGPREMSVLTRKLISDEAAAEWRRERETNAQPASG